MSKQLVDKSRSITLVEAAELYGFSRNYLGNLVRRGRLKASKSGGTWLTRPVDMEMFIGSRACQRGSTMPLARPSRPRVRTQCAQCGKEMWVAPGRIERVKSGKVFCSRLLRPGAARWHCGHAWTGNQEWSKRQMRFL